MIENYAGLIEALIAFFGFLLFFIWQMRELKKLKADRQAQERSSTQNSAGDRPV